MCVRVCVFLIVRIYAKLAIYIPLLSRKIIIVCLHFAVFDGYCSTVQGLLDWVEVDLGFTELLIIQIDLCVMCLFVLYLPVSLSKIIIVCLHFAHTACVRMCICVRRCVRVHVNAHMYICLCTCIRVCVCICTCIYTCICKCVYVCVRVSMCVHI